MPIHTTKTLLDHMNDAWKGKVVYWKNHMGKIQYGVFVSCSKEGNVIVTKKGLSEKMQSKWVGQSDLYALCVDECWLGIYEVVVIDN